MGSSRLRRGMSLLELMFALAIGLPLLGIIVNVTIKLAWAQYDLGQSYQKRQQGNQGLERLALELEQSSSQSPDFDTVGFIRFNLPADVENQWDPYLEYGVNGSKVFYRYDNNTGTSTSMIAGCDSLSITKNALILTFQLWCGKLRYSKTQVSVSRTVVLQE